MQDFLFYLKLGWQHIISYDALDHQLFILVLVSANFYRDWQRILILVTAFTIGHSITLALSILDLFRLPEKIVEILIPTTILCTAVYNLFFHSKPYKLYIINYILALIFGLIHGLGFANTARIMISARQNIAIPLLGFNLGLELGQIVLVFFAMAMLYLLSKFQFFKQKYWVFGISIIAIILSSTMILQRI